MKITLKAPCWNAIKCWTQSHYTQALLYSIYFQVILCIWETVWVLCCPDIIHTHSPVGLWGSTTHWFKIDSVPIILTVQRPENTHTHAHTNMHVHTYTQICSVIDDHSTAGMGARARQIWKPISEWETWGMCVPYGVEIGACCCLTQAVHGTRDVVALDSPRLRGAVWVNLKKKKKRGERLWGTFLQKCR